MVPIALHPIIFYLFVFTAFMLLAYGVVISWFYFSKWFKDVILFVDKQNRWKFVYADTTGKEQVEYADGVYMLNRDKSPPLNKSGKALFKFSVGNPQPESITHIETKEIDSKTIMSIINNKLVQILMSLQSGFMTVQYIAVICAIVSAIASTLTALKVFGIIK